MSNGFAFNSDRNRVGDDSVSQMSGIIKRRDRDMMNINDIAGAQPKIKSYIQKKLHYASKPSSIDKYMSASNALGNGMRHELSEIGDDRVYDTKRFMRVDDIKGARSTNKHTISDKEKALILSNDPVLEQSYQNSNYFRKQKERQGKLPFTRRLNKGINYMDTSQRTTVDPYTGEDYRNPYLNFSMDRPNERMRRNKEQIEEDENQYSNNALQDLRAKRVTSKRSHKLGLTKVQDKTEGYRDNAQPSKNPDNSHQKPHRHENKTVNKTVDYGEQHPKRSHTEGHEYMNMASPQQSPSKRENRLREFYARSQRKDKVGAPFEHALVNPNKSVDRGTYKKRPNANQIMNISQQLDHRNINKHKGRNIFIDNASEGLNDTFSHMKTPEKVYNHKPMAVMSQERLHNSSMHPRGNSYVNSANKTDFFQGYDPSSMLASIRLNPITGLVSPIPNAKAKVF